MTRAERSQAERMTRDPDRLTIAVAIIWAACIVALGLLAKTAV